ncbi:hypothetical protein B0H34DRAFT_795471 [Crassisporium funariophilum]|nr:hypothetical protein B0H34DRAFT_795471 [Crassisporium funariophilum]
MAHILDLAPELIHKIGDQLQSSDKKQLRLVCKHLGGALESTVLHTIVLDINKTNFAKSVDTIKSLAIAGITGAASRSTRVLVLGSLSPTFDPNHDGSDLIFVNGRWVAKTEPPDGPEITIAKDEMRKYLLSALVSLTNIQIVRWNMQRKDEAWAQVIVFDALKSLLNLQQLKLNLTYGHPDIPLAEFRNLRGIALVGHDSLFEEASNPNFKTLTNLAQMIANLPPGQLVSLDVKRGFNAAKDNSVDEGASLHDLLRFYPVDAPPLRLNHLCLSKYSIKLDGLTTRHLHYLNTLDLSAMVELNKTSGPPQQKVSDNSGPKSFLDDKQVVVGSSANEFWTQFARLGICLKNIKLDRIPPAFIAYLGHYTGLRKLALTGGFENGQESDACGSRFFNEALTHHTQTLEELDINACYEGLWCFGEHNLSIVSQCRMLKTLGISVLSDLITTTMSPESANAGIGTQNTLDVLLETVALHMPRLARLSIYPADRERNRGTLWGTGEPSTRHYSHVAYKINQYLRNYSSPPSFSQLPLVVVGRTVFKPLRITGSDSGATWHYQTLP